MTTALTDLLRFLSDSAAVHVAATARRLAVIRIGTRQHICATIWSPDLAITCTWSLPDRDRYLLLLDNGHAVGRLLWRDDPSGLAGLQLETRHDLAALPDAPEIEPDTLLIAVGIDDSGAPVAGLAVLQPAPCGSDGEAANAFPRIDRNIGSGDIGGPVVAPTGALVGIIAHGSTGQGRIGPAHVVPHAEISRLAARPLPPEPEPAALKSPEPNCKLDSPRGWLGMELQPVAVPWKSRRLAGQNSGRKVILVVPGGPADRAGLLAGDIVLTIAENSMVGAGAVRDFLSQERIGTIAEMVLLRAGELISTSITVCARPPG